MCFGSSFQLVYTIYFCISCSVTTPANGSLSNTPRYPNQDASLSTYMRILFRPRSNSNNDLYRYSTLHNHSPRLTKPSIRFTSDILNTTFSEKLIRRGLLINTNVRLLDEPHNIASPRDYTFANASCSTTKPGTESRLLRLFPSLLGFDRKIPSYSYLRLPVVVYSHNATARKPRILPHMLGPSSTQGKPVLWTRVSMTATECEISQKPSLLPHVLDPLKEKYESVDSNLVWTVETVETTPSPTLISSKSDQGARSSIKLLKYLSEGVTKTMPNKIQKVRAVQAAVGTKGYELPKSHSFKQGNFLWTVLTVQTTPKQPELMRLPSNFDNRSPGLIKSQKEITYNYDWPELFKTAEPDSLSYRPIVTLDVDELAWIIFRAMKNNRHGAKPTNINKKIKTPSLEELLDAILPTEKLNNSTEDWRTTTNTFTTSLDSQIVENWSDYSQRPMIFRHPVRKLQNHTETTVEIPSKHRSTESEPFPIVYRYPQETNKVSDEAEYEQMETAETLPDNSLFNNDTSESNLAVVTADSELFNGLPDTDQWPIVYRYLTETNNKSAVHELGSSKVFESWPAIYRLPVTRTSTRLPKLMTTEATLDTLDSLEDPGRWPVIYRYSISTTKILKDEMTIPTKETTYIPNSFENYVQRPLVYRSSIRTTKEFDFKTTTSSYFDIIGSLEDPGQWPVVYRYPVTNSTYVSTERPTMKDLWQNYKWVQIPNSRKNYSTFSPKTQATFNSHYDFGLFWKRHFPLVRSRRADGKGELVGLCYECGLTDRGIPSRNCSDAFSTIDDEESLKLRWSYRTQCHAPIENDDLNHTGGCFLRMLDIESVYVERGCRSNPPKFGKSYASKRFAALETLLDKHKDGCVRSPVATLTPFSRSISLYVKYQACVCSTQYCNGASRMALQLVVVTVVHFLSNKWYLLL